MILFLGLNITSSVLLVFKDSLFALIHWTTNFKSLFICLFIFFIDLSVRMRLVSSAKWWTELNSTDLYKSLMNKINRRGPKTDSCGTPYIIYFLLDWHLFTVVNCILLFRYDWNQLLVIPLIPWCSSFLRSVSWFTVSKAFHKKDFLGHKLV